MEAPPLSPEDLALLDKVAHRVAERRLEAAAIFALETFRGLATIASAAATVAAPIAEHALPLVGKAVPILRFIDSADEYNRLVAILERRENVDLLIQKIEERIR